MSPTLEKASASPLQPRTYPKRWAHQTQALLRKNFFLLWGKKLSLCLALIGPSLAVLLVTLIYSRSDLSPSNIQTELFETKKDYDGLLHWAPSTVPEYSAVVDMFKQALPSARVKGYPTVEAMSEAVMNNWKDRADILNRETAVSFDSTPEGTVSYKLWKLMEEGYSSAGNYYHYGTNDSYIGTVFINLEELTIQSALETSIISARMNYKSPLQLDLRFGLLPNWRVDKNGKKLDTPFPDYLRPISFTLHYLKLIMTLGFLPLMFLGLQQVTMEKSRKLIGAFRKLGLIDSAYWFSTFFTIQLINLMASLFSVFAAKACGSIYPLWAEVDFMVLLLTQFMFGFAFSSLGLVIAAGSNRPMLSIALSSVAIVIPAIVQYIQQSMTFGIDRKNNLTFFEHKDLAEVWKFILCFLFSPSIHYGKIFSDFILRISDYAANLSPLTVVNSYGYGDMDKLYGPYIVDPHSLESDEYFAPSTGSTITYLFAEGIIYFFAAWYLMQVVGSEQEYSRPPHFFLLKSYWFGDNKEGTAEIPGTELERKRAESASNKNLVIHKLSKSFKTSTAVQEFSATINRGTICALLGQNGAGKTTVLGMLSALINPTAGHAFFNGADLETHPDKFRERLGTCPQDDVLYKHISASEHIRLYATFRGYAGGQAMNHLIMDRLESVGLEKHAKKAPGQYSGGMKRRLSVALAFIGDVEMVFLDEPTTGMDPINKRKVWQFIQEEKSNRIVILTTHSMEEADHLGDQICIMHQSRLRAAGTSLYLKNQYGNGYQLTVSTDDVGKIDELVKERLPGASTVATTVGAITISLPKHTLPFLPKFLQRLEILNKGQESESNQTRSEWSLMHTTLESVFFKLCAKENAVDMEGTYMEDNDGQRVSICALCKDRVAEDVVLYTKGGRDVLVSDLICSQCANDDESQAVLPTEPTLMDLDDDLTLPEPLKSVITGGTTPDNESAYDLSDVKHVPPPQREPVPIPTYQTLRQAQAVVFKNMTLRMKYKKANFCLLLTVAHLTACYAIVAMLFPNLNVHRDAQKCKDGFYIIGETCDLNKAAMTLARTSNLPCTGDNCIKAELDPRVWYSDGEGQILNTDFDHLKPTSSLDFGRPLPSQKKVDLLDEYMSGQKYIWEHATINECSPFAYDYPERSKAFLTTNFETAVEEAQRIPDVALRFRAFDLNKETPKVSLDYLLPSDYNSNSTIFYNPNCQSIKALYHNSGSYRRMVAATSSLILSKAAGRPQSVTGSVFDANQSLPKRPLDRFTPIAMMIVIPATLVGLLFTVTPPLIEREEGTYQLALMQGIRPFAYWLGMYAYEFLLLGFLALVMTAIGALIENIRANIGSFLALLLVWAHVVIGFSILLSSVLSSPRVARLIVVIVLLVLPFIGGLYTTKPSTGALLLFPPAAFATLFRAIRLDSQDSVLIPLLSLIGVGSVMLIVGVFIHMWRIGIFGNLWQNKYANAADMNNEDDEESMVFDADVLEERRRVAALKGDGGLAVKIQHLKKSYDGITNVVDGISLGLKYGECFGLLGPNGAGKTTTIDMLLGQIKPSSGEILVGGHAPGSPAVRSMIGICPQHDKVYMELTVEENLLFFARIRGATGKTVRSWVQQAAEQVGLDGDSFRKNGGALSGGMRRRLSIAIALMGSPPIIILDEPTTGLDVENRRHIWDMIAKIKAEGNRLVLLTTHSMEEADALSTRLAIQAGGNLQCIGTQMRLKRKFGDGYQLRVSTRLTIDGVSIEEKSEDKIRMESAELTRFQIIEESVRTLCPAFRTVPLLMGATEHRRDGMTVSEKGIARWKVSRAFIFSEVRDLASIFETMEDLKNRQLVEEWGLEQSTIEDVFIRVAGPYMKED